MAGAAAGIEQQAAQAVEGAGRVDPRRLEGGDHERLCCFGQIRIGEEIRRRRQGRTQVEGLRPHQAGQRHHPADPPPRPADAPGQAVENFILGRPPRDEGEQQVHMPGPRPAAKLAGRRAGAAVVLGQVLPGAGGTGDPEDGVQRAAGVGGWAAPAAGVGWEVAGEEGEFGVGQGEEGVGAHGPTHSRFFSYVQIELFCGTFWIGAHNSPRANGAPSCPLTGSVKRPLAKSTSTQQLLRLCDWEEHL